MNNDSDSKFEALLKETFSISSFLIPGQLLADGRFRIIRLLGRGGMGEVYEAEDTSHLVRVALKRLSTADARGIYRFKQEFRSLVDVSHPNLVGLHALFHEQGHWFFTMDLIYGTSITEWLGSAPSTAAIRRAFSQLAAGVRAIHETGKLHRDLKPSNVMVTADGEVKILDFGLIRHQAKAASEQSFSSGGFSGTLAYMAPEWGTEESLTPAADWYSFGVMLFEVLSGQLPYNGFRPQFAEPHGHHVIPAPSAHRSNIDADLENLCKQLLSIEVDNRPSGEQIAAALGDYERVPVESVMDSSVEELFVGREQELGMLTAAYDFTHTGRPCVVLISGVSGVGKTALVQHFSGGLDPSAIRLSGRCFEQESVPFKACDNIIDALGRYLARLPKHRAAALMPNQGLALARVFPVLEQLSVVREISQRIPLPSDPVKLRRQGFAALKELLSRIAAREPLVLFIDDLQWTDLDSMKLLRSLLSPPDAPQMLLVGAYRSDEIDRSANLRLWLESLESQDHLRVDMLELSPLDAATSLTLAEALLDQTMKEHAPQAAREGMGNPFFISELVRSIRAERNKSWKVEDIIRRRISHLSEEERTVLEVVCVSARPVEMDLLVAHLPNSNVQNAIRKLLTESLIRRTGDPHGRIMSYHDRTRTAVVSAVSESRIVHLHRALARTIEALPDAQKDTATLTHHLMGAKELERAAEVATDAAMAAEQTLAFDEATRLYRIALDHGNLNSNQRHGLEVRLAQALSMGGRGMEAGHLFLTASLSAVDSVEKSELRRRGAEQLLLCGYLDEGTMVLQDSLVELGIDAESLAADPMVLYTSLLERKFSFVEQPTDAIEPMVQRRLQALWAATRSLFFLRNYQAIAFGVRYCYEAMEAGDAHHVAYACWGMVILHAAFFSQVENFPLKQLKRLSAKLDDPQLKLQLAVIEAMEIHFAFRIREAQEVLEKGERIAKQSGMYFTRDAVDYRHMKLLLLEALGEIRQVKLLTQTWHEEAADRDNRAQLSWLCLYRAHSLLADDQPQLARQMKTELYSLWMGKPPEVMETYASRIPALCDAYEGNPEGWAHAKRSLEVFEQSSLKEVYIHCAQQHLYCALVGLSLARNHPNQTEMLQVAETAADMLAQPQAFGAETKTAPYCEPLVKLLRAGIAALKNDVESAAQLLDEALEKFNPGETSRSIRACALWRKGNMAGAAEGQKHIDEANAIFQDLGIVNIERYCNLYAPGF